MEEVHWAQKLQVRTVGYDGAEVYTAERLDLEGICAELPPAGVGGFVSTVLGEKLFWIRTCVLKINAQEDERPRDPMVWAFACGLARACSGTRGQKHLRTY